MAEKLKFDVRFPPPAPEECAVCPICDTKCEPPILGSDSAIYKCPRCSCFEVSGTVGAMLSNINKRQRRNLTGYVRDQTILRMLPKLTDEIVRESGSWPEPGLQARAKKLLSWGIALRDRRPHRDDSFDLFSPMFWAASYSAGPSEILRVARVLHELEFIELTEVMQLQEISGAKAAITAKGRLFIEAEAAKISASTRGFAAMWFDPTMDDAWGAMSEAISVAGYDPVRIDRVEHLNRIDDEIMLQIQKARFVVADFTGHRTGVYFEAGYALGLGIPVVWTCRKDDLNELHFDIRQYNCVVWEKLGELVKALAFRIEATVGPGPRKITS